MANLSKIKLKLKQVDMYDAREITAISTMLTLTSIKGEYNKEF